MFPAPPLPRGRDLNEVERESMYQRKDPLPSIFGPLTPASQQIAYDIKQQTPSVDISALFSMIEQQQAPSSPAASSVPAGDDEPTAMLADDLDMPDDLPEIQPPPRPTKRSKSSKSASSKSKPPASVVNKVTTDF